MSEDDTKRPVGRPSEYDPAYCERVIELGKLGYSKAEIASDLDCSRTTLDAWAKATPPFLDALNRAKDEELAYFERHGREGMFKGAGFNATIWAKSVSGRFPAEPYRERHEIAGPDGGPIKSETVIDPSKLTAEQLRVLASIPV